MSRDREKLIDEKFPVDPSTAVPAARPPSDFCIEQIDDDFVIFDSETMQYHTLNGVAERIWRACDGTATIDAIAASSGLPTQVVETTVAELGEASLLQTPSSTWSVSMNRRRATKLIAVGAVGAVGVPLVSSITAPMASAQLTPTCVNVNAPCSSVGATATACSGGTLTCLHVYSSGVGQGFCNTILWLGSGFTSCTP